MNVEINKFLLIYSKQEKVAYDFLSPWNSSYMTFLIPKGQNGMFYDLPSIVEKFALV